MANIVPVQTSGLEGPGTGTWQAWFGCTIAKTENEAFEGSGSLEITTSDTIFGIQSSNWPGVSAGVIAEHEYECYWAFRVPALVSGSIEFRISWRNESGTELLRTDVPIVVGVGLARWVLSDSVLVTTPVGTTRAFFMINRTSGLTAPLVLHADSFVVDDEPEGEPVPDPLPDGNPSPPVGQEWSLYFEDQFETINTDLWYRYENTYGDGGFGSIDRLRDQNISASNGTLTITTKREQFDGKDFTSGFISTGRRGTQATPTPPSETFFPRAGFYEIRARSRQGQGLTQAFWLRHRDGGGGGVADVSIMENLHAQTPGKTHQVCNLNAGFNTFKVEPFFQDPTTTPDWHTFGVAIWEESQGIRFKFYVDGVETGSFLETDKDFWTVNPAELLWDISMNTHTGGFHAGHPNDDPLGRLHELNRCSIGWTQTGYPDDCLTELDGHAIQSWYEADGDATYDIDYVRVWSLEGLPVTDLKNNLECGEDTFTVLDTFTATNGTSLAVHTADSGHTWSTDPTDGLEIQSNRVLPLSNGARGISDADGFANAELKATINFGDDGLARAWSIRFRWADNNNFLFVKARRSATPVNQIELWERIDGVETRLRQITLGAGIFAANTDYVLRIEADGSTIRAYIDDDLVMTEEDVTQLATATRVGFGHNESISANMRFDDFGAAPIQWGGVDVTLANSGCGTNDAFDHVFGDVTYNDEWSARGDQSALSSVSASATANCGFDSTPDRAWGRFYINKTANPPANLMIARFVTADGDAIHLMLRILSNGNLAITDSGFTNRGTAALSNDQHRIEWEVRTGTSEVELVKLRVYSGENVHGTEPDITLDSTSMSVTAWDRIRIGIQFSSSQTYSLAWDEIRLSSEDWIGPASEPGPPIDPPSLELDSLLDVARSRLLTALSSSEPNINSVVDLMRILLEDESQTLVDKTDATAAVHLWRYLKEIKDEGVE